MDTLARLNFLGAPSVWLKPFLDKLQKAGLFDLVIGPDITRFLAVPVPRSRVGIILLEQNAGNFEDIEALRRSGRRILLIWVGKSFCKDELLFAIKHRVYAVLENPTADEEGAISQFKGAMSQAQMLERSEDLLYCVKSALLEMDGAKNPTASLHELKTGLSNLERASLQNEFLGTSSGALGETRLPFYKAQALADALMMMQDLERTGSLSIKSKEGHQGRVDFLQGRPVSAVCGEARSLKAIYRMFLWAEATFAFTRLEPGATTVEEKFAMSLREICQEGEALHHRYEGIRAQAPPAQLRLVLDPTALKTATKLDRFHFSTLSSIVELGRVSQVLDYNLLPDVVLYECLIDLKKSGIIKIAG